MKDSITDALAEVNRLSKKCLQLIASLDPQPVSFGDDYPALAFNAELLRKTMKTGRRSLKAHPGLEPILYDPAVCKPAPLSKGGVGVEESGVVAKSWHGWAYQKAWHVLRELDGGKAPVDLAVDPLTLMNVWGYIGSEQRAVETAINAASDGDPDPKGEADPPKTYLHNWREILVTLEMKNNSETRDKVRRLNDLYDGPIIPALKQGGQPMAERGKLLDWWNRLETMIEDQRNQAKGSLAEAKEQYDYGRTGTVAPGISGEIRQRRSDRSEGG